MHQLFQRGFACPKTNFGPTITDELKYSPQRGGSDTRWSVSCCCPRLTIPLTFSRRCLLALYCWQFDDASNCRDRLGSLRRQAHSVTLTQSRVRIIPFRTGPAIAAAVNANAVLIRF